LAAGHLVSSLIWVGLLSKWMTLNRSGKSCCQLF